MKRSLTISLFAAVAAACALSSCSSGSSGSSPSDAVSYAPVSLSGGSMSYNVDGRYTITYIFAASGDMVTREERDTSGALTRTYTGTYTYEQTPQDKNIYILRIKDLSGYTINSITDAKQDYGDRIYETWSIRFPSAGSAIGSCEWQRDLFRFDLALRDGVPADEVTTAKDADGKLIYLERETTGVYSNIQLRFSNVTLRDPN